MATQIFSSDSTSQININTSDDRWEILAGVTIDVAGTSAIYQSAAFDSATVIVRGTVRSDDPNFAAIVFDGVGNRLTVGRQGEVEGVHGISAGIDGVVNIAGTVLASINGIEARTVSNSGTVDAQYGVILRPDGSSFDNKTGGQVLASQIGVLEESNGTATITNHGLIRGTNEAIYCSGLSAMTLVNFGRISGEVFLGAGNDSFTNRGGRTGASEILGGLGDDSFRIDRTGIKIREDFNEGHDTVTTSVTHFLGANFEDLVVVGRRDVGGYGNELANTITDKSRAGNVLNAYEGNDDVYGGRGANHIYGGEGDDRIWSGSGNESFWGELGADSFVIDNGAGRDRIYDFTDGLDLIDISSYAGIDDFSDLAGRISQSGTVTTIALDGGDRLRLLDFDSADLDGSDFIF